jgi:opacity protein-like surface antigen
MRLRNCPRESVRQFKTVRGRHDMWSARFPDCWRRHMKCRCTFVSALALLAATASVRAGDLAPVHQASPASAQTWTGFYAGATLGWARGGSSGSYHGISPPPPPIPPHAAFTSTCGDPDADRTIASAAYVICALLDPITPGALAGYDFRLGSMVAGLEADVGWIGRHSPVTPASDGSTRWDQFGVTWTGHVRGRFGYPVGNYLPYVAGGLALAGFNAAHFRSDATGSALYSASDTRAGFSIGAGIEVADLFPTALPGWVFRAEYVYDHFPDKQYDWVPGMRYSVLDLTINTLRAGVTYRFSSR